MSQKTLDANLKSLGINSIPVFHTLIELTPDAEEHKEELIEVLESIQPTDLKRCMENPSGIFKIIDSLRS